MQRAEKQETDERKELFCKKQSSNEVWHNVVDRATDRKWCDGKCNQKGCKFTSERRVNLLVGGISRGYVTASFVLQIRPMGHAE
jgi:hypothetical protein